MRNIWAISCRSIRPIWSYFHFWNHSFLRDAMDDLGWLTFMTCCSWCILCPLHGTAVGCLSALRKDSGTKATGCSGGFDCLTVGIPFGPGGRNHGWTTPLWELRYCLKDWDPNPARGLSLNEPSVTTGDGPWQNCMRYVLLRVFVLESRMLF